MEDSNQVPASDPVSPGVQTPVTPPPSEGGSKMVLWLVLGLVLVVVVVGGIYWVLNRKQAETQPTANTGTTTPKETTSADTLEKDVNAVDVVSPDADFKDVDTDLQNL